MKGYNYHAVDVRELTGNAVFDVLQLVPLDIKAWMLATE